MAVGTLGLRGPLAPSLASGPLHWEADLGYKRFLGATDDIIGFTDYVEVGAALAWEAGWLPLGREAVLGGALLVGDDLFGWNVSIAVRF